MSVEMGFQAGQGKAILKMIMVLASLVIAITFLVFAGDLVVQSLENTTETNVTAIVAVYDDAKTKVFNTVTLAATMGIVVVLGTLFFKGVNLEEAIEYLRSGINVLNAAVILGIFYVVIAIVTLNAGITLPSAFTTAFTTLISITSIVGLLLVVLPVIMAIARKLSGE